MEKVAESYYVLVILVGTCIGVGKRDLGGGFKHF